MVEEVIDVIEEIDELEEVDLQELIVDGADYKQTVSVELATGKTGAVLIKPVTISEYDDCVRKYRKHRSNIKLVSDICQKGLLNTKEEPYTMDMIRKLPAGVILKLSEQIQKISGIEPDEEAKEELRKKLLDF